MKAHWTMPLLFLLFSCSKSEEPKPLSLDSWVSQSLGSGENLLCKASQKGDLFFVSAAGADRVRIGSRLRYTGTDGSNGSVTKYWRIKNENGETLTGLRPPDSIVQKNPTSSDPYDESILYFYPTLGGSQRIIVGVDVKRCSSNCEGEEAQAYTLRVCDVPLP